MDFDEYEYLEKTVEETEPNVLSSKKNKDKDDSGDKSSKGYRRRDRDDEDGSGDDEDKKSKKSRAEDENGGRQDRDGRERSSRTERHRSSRDGEREKYRGRSSREDRGSEREMDRGSREKDKERDREKRETEKEREKERTRKDKEKDPESDREKDRERERSRRSRSRSKSSRMLESDRGRERETLRERGRELEARDGRRFKDKKELVEPEHDPERDQRTVFAFQMPLKATERDVYEFFSKAGKVRDVRLIMDRNSRRSKGVGYVEFYDAMSVPMAIALTGQLLLGQPVIVKPSEAEKNLVQSTASAAGSAAGPYGAVDRKLYVGNLHFNMTELQLRQIFEAFGPVELVQLPTDPETGHCKGFGFIQFSKLEDAKAAVTLNGQLEIAGRVIKVSSVTDHVGVQESGAKAADFDDDDGGGLALNAQSRALLMQKLDRSGTATSITGSLGVPALNGAASGTLPINGQAAIPATALPAIVVTEPIGIPSECLLLKNMFDPSMEMDPEYDLEIKDDVEAECSKYGPVLHAHVDKNSAGYVYLRFETIQASAAAQAAMHKRWFARRLISAVFLQPYEYDAKFKHVAAA